MLEFSRQLDYNLGAVHATIPDGDVWLSSAREIHHMTPSRVAASVKVACGQ